MDNEKTSEIPSESRVNYAEWIIAIPIAHISLSALFLWGYSMGFDRSIQGLISTSDILQNGSSQLISMYGVFVLALFTSLLFNHGMDWSKDVYGRKWQYVFCLIVMVIPFLSGIWITALRSDSSDLLFPSISSLVVPIAFVTIWYADAFQKSIRRAALFSAAIFMPLFSATTGYILGEAHRSTAYSDLGYVYYCNEAKVIRPIGGYYIAQLPSNRHVIIDDECLIKFTFDPPEQSSDPNVVQDSQQKIR